jgi:hypothetical protein
MPVRKRGNSLERWEIALIKAMLARGGNNDQDILAYFTRPTRSINHARISEIRTGARYKAAKAATEDELDAFFTNWPEVDPETGLSLRGDELLIKAREAMIAAVHIFNGAGLTFARNCSSSPASSPGRIYCMPGSVVRASITGTRRPTGQSTRQSAGRSATGSWASACVTPDVRSRRERSRTSNSCWSCATRSSIAQPTG